MNSANLSWTPATDTVSIEGYQVFRQAGGGASTLIATTDGGVNHYNATHLVCKHQLHLLGQGHRHTAQVSATPSSASFTTLANPNTTPPSPPADASVAAHAFSSTRVDVVWAGSPTADVSGYQVYYSTDTATRSPGSTCPAACATPTTGSLPAPNTATSSGRRLGRQHLGADHHQAAGLRHHAGNRHRPARARPVHLEGDLQLGDHLLVDQHRLGRHRALRHQLGGSHRDRRQRAAPRGDSDRPDRGTTYTYNVGTGSAVLATATFRTAAAAGSTFSFAAIGDFGGASPGEAQNAANIATAGTSFMQTLGDNIYPSAGNPDPNFSTTYSDFDARFFKQFGPVVKTQAFFPANGNQEYYSNGAFWSTFPMPGSNHSWYSYNWGNAHILVLDSEQAVRHLQPAVRLRPVRPERQPVGQVADRSDAAAAVQLRLRQLQLAGGAVHPGAAVPEREGVAGAVGQQPQLRAVQAAHERQPGRRWDHLHRQRRGR